VDGVRARLKLLLILQVLQMGRAIVTSIRIDEDVLRRAKEVGLNISKVSENALKEAIARLEGPVRGGARK